MFWRKVFHVLVISFLLVGGFNAPSTAGEIKLLAKTSVAKLAATTYTVCASGCDFSSIQTAIDSVSAGDMLSLAAETFTESITINKSLNIEGAGQENTIMQAAISPGIATNRVITVTENVSVTIQGLTARFGVTPTIYDDGGGIHNAGALTLTHSTIFSNTAGNMGGGIANSGTLILVHSNINQNSAYSAGGILNEDYSTAILTSTVISGNFTTGDTYGFGGGIVNFNHGDMSLYDVLFNGNRASQTGGGMSSGNGSAVLKNVTFSNNLAGYNATGEDKGHGSGGGLSGSNLTLTDVTFSNNQSSFEGGGMSTGGSSRLEKVTFINNQTSWVGGGMYNQGDVTLIDVGFFNNLSGDHGGGLYNEWGSPTLNRITFSGNSAEDNGGGMVNQEGNPSLINVLFSNNSATQSGGGLYNSIFSDQTISLLNVTFFNNSAGDDGGGLYNYYAENYDSYITMTNCILWGNNASGDGQQISNTSLIPIISTCDIQDSGGSGENWNNDLGLDGGGNIDADPLFVNPLNDDLHLTHGSPAIDAGDDSNCPLTDLDGVPRPQGNGCDMGAYEFEPFELNMLVDNPIAEPGEIVTYTIRVTNNMTEIATGGVISNTLPVGLNFLETIILEPPDAGTIGSPPSLVSDLEIGAGGQVTVTLPVAVSYGLAGGTTITNTAWVTSTEVISPVLGSATITIANAPPVAFDDSDAGFITDEDTSFTTTNVLPNDTDPNGDTLTVESFNATGTKGLVTDNGDGTFEYDPDGQFEDLDAGDQATDTFTYTINDGNGGTDNATVSIAISGVDDTSWLYLPLVVGK